MPVEFIQKRDEFGSFFEARVHSPYGGMIDINPFEPTEVTISHQNKGGRNGFGVKFTNGKQSRVLQVKSLGEATDFLREVRNSLSKQWFWKQEE